MREAITSKQNTLDAFYDHRILEAPFCLIVDINTQIYEVIHNKSLQNQNDVSIPCLNELVSRKIDIIIAGKCDERIIRELSKRGIRVYHGKNASIRQNIEDLNENHLLSCLHSNYIFNVQSEILDEAYDISDMNEIIAGCIPNRDKYVKKLNIEKNEKGDRINQQT